MHGLTNFKCDISLDEIWQHTHTQFHDAESRVHSYLAHSYLSPSSSALLLLNTVYNTVHLVSCLNDTSHRVHSFKNHFSVSVSPMKWSVDN